MVFAVVDEEDNGQGASGLTINGPAPDVVSASTRNDAADNNALRIGDTAGDAMTIDVPSLPVSATAQEDDAMSTHSSMPDLISIWGSEDGENHGEDDLLDLLDLYMDDEFQREPVTADEIYASRLFAEDEMLLDPEEEARIREIWAEVDRIRMPLPSDTSSESDEDSEDEMKEIAREARERRFFPSFHLPDLPSNMYPPSDSDDTDYDSDEEEWDMDQMLTRATGLNSEEYDALQVGFQNGLAARDMERNSDTWYTPLPLDSPGAGFGANTEGETLLDLQSFLNLESPGFDDSGSGVRHITII